MDFKDFLANWSNTGKLENPSITFLYNVGDRFEKMIIRPVERDGTKGLEIFRSDGINKEPVEWVPIRCCLDHLIEDAQRRAYTVYMALQEVHSNKPPDKTSPWYRPDNG